MSDANREQIADELDLMRRMLPLAGTRVADLGCGNGQMAIRILGEGHATSVIAFEVDRVQHAKNIAAAPRQGLSFVLAGADDIPLQDASIDIATMFKSLHHVPLDRLDTALAEIARVLVPGGLLYVSEPVFDGPFNEIVRLFHDEEIVRAAALAALRRAASGGTLQMVQEYFFDAPIAFRDFDDFVERIVRVTHTEHLLVGERLAEVRRQFDAHMTGTGARFVRPMRVNLMRRVAASSG